MDSRAPALPAVAIAVLAGDQLGQHLGGVTAADIGEAATLLEEVPAAAGVSGSPIYHYFTDIQALLLAVIDRQTEAVLDLQAPYLDHLDTITGLRAWRPREKPPDVRSGWDAAPLV